MIKINCLIVSLLIGFLLCNCHIDNPDTPKTISVSILLAPYCPARTNFYKNRLITIVSFLDKVNASTTNYFLLPDKNKVPTISNVFNNSFIGVYCSESDLSKYFFGNAGDYYAFNFDTPKQ